MDKRWLAALLVMLLFCPVLAQDLGDVPNPVEEGGVGTMPAETLGALGAVGGATGTELLPLWDFWLEFTINFWNALKDYTEALIGYELKFDEYLVYKIFGVGQESFEEYCGVIRNAPTEEDPFNMEISGVKIQWFLVSILLLFVTIIAISMSYGGISKIPSLGIVGLLVLMAVLLFFGSNKYFPLALDLITIALFFFVVYNLMMGSEDTETAPYGSFAIVLIPLAVLLIFAITHLLSYMSSVGSSFGQSPLESRDPVSFVFNLIMFPINLVFNIINFFTKSWTPEEVQIVTFTTMFILGLIVLVIGTIGFILDLTHVGDRSEASKIIREVDKLRKGFWKGAGTISGGEEALKDHLINKYGLDEGKTTALGGLMGGGTAGAGYKEAKKNFYGAYGLKKTAIGRAREAGLGPLLWIIVGLVFMFVGLSPLGFRLPPMNIVAVYYLAIMIIMTVFMSAIPSSDPMVFFEDADARGVIMQINHVLGYDKNTNIMKLLQRMGKSNQKEYDEETAKFMKKFSGQTLELVQSNRISQQMYPVLTEGYENMVKAPFYQILQVRDTIIWSLLVLVLSGFAWFILAFLPGGFFGLAPLVSEWMDKNTLGCVAMNFNIFTLILWASFIVSLVVFIVRRSAFALTLLLPDSIYIVINTVFGKRQLFSVIAKVMISVIIAVMALERIDIFKVQDMVFYFQPFFAVAVTGAIMFISTLFYIFETFALATMGGFLHSLLSMMGSGFKRIFDEMQTGRIGIVLGGICIVLALMILIPYYLYGGAEAFLGWSGIWAFIAGLFLIIPAVTAWRKGASIEVIGVFFGFAGLVCVMHAFTFPLISGWTLVPIGAGLILFGGKLE